MKLSEKKDMLKHIGAFVDKRAAEKVNLAMVNVEIRLGAAELRIKALEEEIRTKAITTKPRLRIAAVGKRYSA